MVFGDGVFVEIDFGYLTDLNHIWWWFSYSVYAFLVIYLWRFFGMGFCGNRLDLDYLTVVDLK